MPKKTVDRTNHIRSHLEKKSKDELVNLLLDLVRGMDEPTRQRFWEHLAPPGMATADLRYPSAEDFLAELETFSDDVADCEYYDEEAAIALGEDSYYDEVEEFDPDDHKGLQALRGYFHETGTYFGYGLPLQLRLLLRFYQEAGRSADFYPQWIRFRKLYPACYLPLLETLEKAGDWQAVLEYGQEAVKIVQAPRSPYMLRNE